MIVPAPETSLRCLLVDDSEPFLAAARKLLAREGLEVVGTASTSAEALELAARLRPDVTLVDIHLGRESGFDLVRELAGGRRQLSAVNILISTHEEKDFRDLIEASPADGFLAKAELSAVGILRILDAA
jgi:DNA-binding NarL/FixJ family response regulator